MDKTLPWIFKCTDGRTYRVVGVNPFRVEVLNRGVWVELCGHTGKRGEIWRAYQKHLSQ